MAHALLSLVGRHVTAADVVHDYVQLKFDNGDVMNVFNEYGLEGAEASGIHAIVGLCVAAVSVQSQELRIDFGGLKLSVSLLDAAFRGPEAIEYIPTVGSRVVLS